MSGTIIQLWLARAPWSKHPLVRHSDRRDSVVAVLAVVFSLLLLPVAATFGSVTYTDMNTRAAQERATASQTMATVTAPPIQRDSMQEPAVPVRASAPATWTAPDGSQRAQNVQVDSDAVVGDTVLIWIDPRGEQIAAPKTGVEAAGIGVVVSLALWFTGSLIALAGVVAMRSLGNRQRMRKWETDWSTFDEHHGRNIEW
ncbi:hypothetical protein [Rhodococcus sovatensis]|uniref:Transmembrane protein n=1 Tax=Rhodococcus sovatensis TaxID=1805840 RepID=A0ABZ2PCK5_9NOCA